ncbi:MAG: CoA-binding protein [Humidesulfovibrio sp.]|uniref:CoA-binding protein n=1 Tax=Humidesulfovibrio sp. TaxID=2910988 RepID=UPI002736E37B|nr:CoA-binding protein [Humidesulfovibrio sp.]MDP2848079.1 CoA-binding protein [Humidesulfovibrio sp.]
MLYSDKELAALLEQVKTIAIVGAKDKPGQPVDMVGRYLIKAGFTIIPVHPKRTSVWGIPAYPSLADVPKPIDLVNLFRAAEACPAHAQETLLLPNRPRCFWMQSGINSAQARQTLDGCGIFVVEDRCLMVEHARLLKGDANA